MAIKGIRQPEILVIDETLRLRMVTDDCGFALDWYQDEETLLLVDGKNEPYDMERLMRMYHYLADHGEAYFIEAKASAEAPFVPIGDVTFWQEDLPIVIGRKEWRQKGVGKRVVRALMARARTLGFSCLRVQEIYDYNTGSQRLFESLGFRKAQRTEKGYRYWMDL